MLPIKSYSQNQFAAVQEACAYFFPPKQIFDISFLRNIDRSILDDVCLRKKKQVQRIIKGRKQGGSQDKAIYYHEKMRQAYVLLSSAVNGDFPEIKSDSGPKIIAVGGSKGGIGKSMFAANVSVFLAQKGFSVIAMDLDLGGANLALYLGEKYILDRTINDFLKKKYPSLEDIIIDSSYGPKIIGGDSSELGAANIHHAQKMKLIRAIKGLDADFIILDLGGDTSFNMLDFFLLADHGLVITTRDSASYIGSYQFIKTALYRKINRLADHLDDAERDLDPQLSTVLKKCTVANGQPMSQTIVSLLDRVAENDPFDLPQVLKSIIGFKPHLIVNRAPSLLQANQVAHTISDLAKRYLSVRIGCPGHINKYPEIEDNLSNNAPLVARDPDGKLAGEISVIVTNIGL
ncbi:MAG: AAA family ATPase [Desulfobulbaceae bacterium]|uniref:AAA family ATPase n=1 Tax=Candidatus Desulfobia pelagia TaxID=2841692 RepID=A0A8J6TFR6_9BACT|nr:AAA family ATPase [Candidatus Desulfobia pelagia]